MLSQWFQMSAIPQPQVAQIITPSGQIQQIQLTHLGGLAGSNVISQAGQANMIAQSSQSNFIPVSQPNILAAAQGNQGNILAQTSQGNIISQANLLAQSNQGNLITQVCSLNFSRSCFHFFCILI